jgi:hypothetical protein
MYDRKMEFGHSILASSFPLYILVGHRPVSSEVLILCFAQGGIGYNSSGNVRFIGEIRGLPEERFKTQ